VKRRVADPQANIEHRRSSVREGWQTLLIGGCTIAGLAACPLFFSDWHWKNDPGFVIIWYSFLGLFGLLLAYYAFSNIIQCRDFVCRIDDQSIECQVPFSGAGDSFRLPLNEIVKVEKRSSGESYNWYIWDAAGKQYQLTTNYGNPAKRFIQAILERNSAVVDQTS
jgi:hypothetical protein